MHMHTHNVQNNRTQTNYAVLLTLIIILNIPLLSIQKYWDAIHTNNVQVEKKLSEVIAQIIKGIAINQLTFSISTDISFAKNLCHQWKINIMNIAAVKG